MIEMMICPLNLKIYFQFGILLKIGKIKKSQQVLKDGIHILIDMQGHSASNRLPIFFYKPAPIQLTWLGQGSSGISEIDYFLGSPEITPKEEEKHYIEKVLRPYKYLSVILNPISK